MTRTTKTTTRKPTYVTNTNAKGTKTGVSNNSRGTKTTVVKNTAGTTYTKVTNAAGKTFTKATDSKGNVIKPKVTAKVVVKATPKVTPKVTATKPVVNNKVKTATAVPTPRATSTSGKTYLIETNKGKQWGTAAQQDSVMRAAALWNPDNKEPFNPADRVVGGYRTKQGYDRDMATYAKNPKMLKMLTGPGRKKREELPDYKASPNTGAGKLLYKPEFKGITGTGGCLKGYSLDRNGRCVKTSPD